MNISEVTKAIDAIIKAEDDDLKATLKALGYENVDETIDAMNTLEDTITDLLEEERKLFLKGIVDDQEFQKAVAEIRKNALADVLATSIATEAESLLRPFVESLTEIYMDTVDPEVGFVSLSDFTNDYLTKWSESLGTYMQDTSQEKLETMIVKGTDEGIAMTDFIEQMEENYSWSRERARRIAQTEVLTSHAYSQNEAYRQSPAVKGKKWKHSGGKGIDPRPSHVALDGTVVACDEKFTIVSDTGTYHADMPRDVTLPPSERVYCHCTLGPDVDNDILGLTAEEKQTLRDEALADWNLQNK